jgi:1,4-dihydroxy-2-naphthoate octaprenyltransferase
MTDRVSTELAGTASRPSQTSAWILATRTRTLSLSIAPVAVGASIAWADTERLRWSPVVVAALAAALIQIGTNLYNDAADHRRGADGPARVGPLRVTAQGLLGVTEVGRAAFLCFAGAAAAGTYLAAVGGWPILALGLVSIACGLAYSGGPRPIAYTPFGEAFALTFFGIAAVGGTYWLAAGAIGPAPVVAGVAVGLFAAAVLLVNNHRDRQEDARVGRRTLAIAIGGKSTHWLYATLMLLPFVLVFPLAWLLTDVHVWIALIAAPLALVMTVRFVREPPGPGFNDILAQTAQTQTVYVVLLCLGALV